VGGRRNPPAHCECDYNEDNGLLEAVSSGSSEVDYTYNAMGALAAVSQATDANNTIANSYSYDNDRLTTINHNGFNYTFEYDAFGNVTNVKVGTQSLVSYTYGTGANRNRIASITYGNGQTVTYAYDNDNNVTGVSYDGSATYRYTYTYSDGKLASYTDYANNTVTTYNDNGYEVRTNDAASTLIYSSSTNSDGDTVKSFGTNQYTYNAAVSNYDGVSGYTTETQSITGANVNLKTDNVTDYFERTLTDSLESYDSSGALISGLNEFTDMTIRQQPPQLKLHHMAFRIIQMPPIRTQRTMNMSMSMTAGVISPKSAKITQRLNAILMIMPTSF
jgi:YD repeat-containing protein